MLTGKLKFFVLAAILLLGCETTSMHVVGLPSPYASYYNKGFESSLAVPETSMIRKTGRTHEYNRSFEEVWEATLDVISQYQGILDIKSSGSQGSMLVIKAREHKHGVENRKRSATYGNFFEQWLGVAVTGTPGASGTEVAVAAFEPSTGSLRNNEGVANLLFSQIQIHLFGRPSWREKFVYDKRPQHNIRESEVLHNDDYQEYKHRELEELLGCWVSKGLREEFVTVYAPDVTSWLDDIVVRLKQAAGAQSMRTQVTVIPSNRLNAFALTNGDIFVSSGLLDKLFTEDEVAAVLAHELDHLINHDIIKGLALKRRGAVGAAFLRTSMAFGTIVLSGYLGTSDIGTVANAFIDAGKNGADHLGVRGQQYMETTMGNNFTADTELRADENGIKNLYAAGFKPETNIAMLKTLLEFQDKTLETEEFVLSNLINKNPGLDERIKKLEEVLVEIKR